LCEQWLQKERLKKEVERTRPLKLKAETQAGIEKSAAIAKAKEEQAKKEKPEA
jgi:hypothetical protein